MCANEVIVLDFFVHLFNDCGLGYSALNTARSALSSFLFTEGGLPIGKLPLIQRFLKGVYELRPSVPRYKFVWDVKIVLDFLVNLFPLSELCLKMLTLKLVTLIALITAQRAQTISLLDTTNMKVGKNSYNFIIPEHIKQSRIGNKNPIISLRAFPSKKALCVCHTLNEYLDRTKDLRKLETRLFVSFQKPHKAIGTNSVGRWIKEVLKKAGIDTEIFKAHSTRTAATSAAKFNSVPIDEILKTAGWSNENVFTKFYDKPIIFENKFSDSVLKN